MRSLLPTSIAVSALTNTKSLGAEDGLPVELHETGRALNATEADLIEAKEVAGRFTLEDTKRVGGCEFTIFFASGADHSSPGLQLMAQVHKQHCRDPNFPIQIIEKIEGFLGAVALPRAFLCKGA